MRRPPRLDSAVRVRELKRTLCLRHHDRSCYTLSEHRSGSNPYLRADQHSLVRAVLYRGLLLGWAYVVQLLRNKRLWAGVPFRGKPPATAEDIGDLFVWMTLGVIIGGRLGYVLLYGMLYCGFAGHGAPACGGLPEAYFTNPIKIIAAWEGGMSFHGGLARRSDCDSGCFAEAGN